jgi:hypothetical protein
MPGITVVGIGPGPVLRLTKEVEAGQLVEECDRRFYAWQRWNPIDLPGRSIFHISEFAKPFLLNWRNVWLQSSLHTMIFDFPFSLPISVWTGTSNHPAKSMSRADFGTRSLR